MRPGFLAVLGLALFTSSGAVAAAPAAPSKACEHEMTVAAEKYGVPLAVLYAVGLTESGDKGSLQPLAMNVGGKPYYAKDVADGLQEFADATASGIVLIDIGCMQIDHRYHGEYFSSVAAMFDPHENVDYGARLLSQLFTQEKSWTLAVARYHAGPGNEPAQKEYVCRVLANMVATGFGTWTDAAKAFCA